MVDRQKNISEIKLFFKPGVMKNVQENVSSKEKGPIPAVYKGHHGKTQTLHCFSYQITVV